MADSGDPQQQQQEQEVCSFFKKPSKNKNLRKRPTLEEDNVDEDSKDGSSVVYNKKKPPAGDSKLHFSTGSSKHRLDKEAEKEEPKLFQFESSKEIQVHNDSRATATLETETEFSRDARALREKALKKAEEDASNEPGASSDGGKLYKGIHGYTDHRAAFRRENTVAAEKAGGAHGPLRASAHIRVSARFDYQPDICKDYKETGYCGYGDACKFMHDRGDYKSGWQLERDWDEAEKVRRTKLFSGVKNEDEDEDAADKSDKDEDDSLPFACFICRRPFEDPVETLCKHYFCEHCALKHHRTNKKCFVCNQPTNGIFNSASKILKKMSSEQK